MSYDDWTSELRMRLIQGSWADIEDLARSQYEARDLFNTGYTPNEALTILTAEDKDVREWERGGAPR